MLVGVVEGSVAQLSRELSEPAVAVASTEVLLPGRLAGDRTGPEVEILDEPVEELDGLLGRDLDVRSLDTDAEADDLEEDTLV